MTVFEGHPARLTCLPNEGIETNDTTKVVWTDWMNSVLTFNQQRIIDDLRLIPVGLYDLIISRVRHSDQGIYWCGLSSPAAPRTFEIRLNVLLANSEDDAVIETVEGSTLKIKCPGRENGTVSWHREDGADFCHSLNDTNGVLQFKRVSRECKGVYACVISTSSSSKVLKMIKLVVKFSPELTLFPRQSRLDQTNGTVTCVAKSYPPANITWTLNNVEITDGEKYQIELENSRSVLRINRVSRTDSGVYRCSAENDVGMSDVDFSLLSSGKSSQHRFRQSILPLISVTLLVNVICVFF